MSSRISSASDSLDWKKAYMEAVLEKDRGRLPGLIQVATQKLSERVRELWRSEPVPCDELEALDDALYLLQALRSSISYRDDLVEWSRSSVDS